MTRTRIAGALALLLMHARACLAIDSYRYLHVSIETPWMIFLFLLIAIFVPFILMVVLSWRQAGKSAPRPRDPPQ